jgi:hypothetical protein
MWEAIGGRIMMQVELGKKKKNGRPYLKITEAKEILLGGVK